MEIEQKEEEPPGRHRPPGIWADVPLEKWTDWRWQLAHRLNTVEELGQVIRLTPEEVQGLSAPGRFRVDITPYFASLIDPDDPPVPSAGRSSPPTGVGALYGRDGRLAGRRCPLPGAGPGAPLSRPGADAGHHAVRQLLPLLHPQPHRRRPERSV